MSKKSQQVEGRGKSYLTSNESLNIFANSSQIGI